MSLLLALLFGIGFGYILQRVEALEYKNIINALRLKDLTIPKFMLFSVAITCVGIFSLRTAGLVSLDLITTNVVGNIIGGLIFGVGFAFSGYCPGTSIGAMGEGKRDAKYTVIGGVFGVLLYTLIQQYTNFSIAKFDIGKISLVDIVQINPFSLAVMFSSILVIIIYAIDYLEKKKIQG
ncbi:YeeE/YedE thiosulfate transporter family protein [Clostridium sp. BSD9I1]|uniref:YeeE/YedE thiosulfate transporter family protein n=1 Tax=Clostridium sp. BSD9I1 TaxID=2003589 RepID=UPI0016492652|nr:YeeE/YedE thiosulfate transporter family protein [Clostridium sp. BSD9I1]